MNINPDIIKRPTSLGGPTHCFLMGQASIGESKPFKSVPWFTLSFGESNHSIRTVRCSLGPALHHDETGFPLVNPDRSINCNAPPHRNGSETKKMFLSKERLQSIRPMKLDLRNSMVPCSRGIKLLPVTLW